MKNLFSRHYSLVSFFALCCAIVGLAACQKEPIIGCEHPISKDSLCSGKEGKTVTVRVGEAVCGYGAWGGLWLQPINNPSISVQWLQPYSLEKGLSYQPKIGETLQITYANAQPDDRYKNVVTCMAYPGSSIPIHILCIKPTIPTPNDSTAEKTTIVEIKTALCGTGVWNDLWAWELDSLSGKDMIKKWLRPFSIHEDLRKEFAKVQLGDRYKITYKPTNNDGRYDNLIVCKAYPGQSLPIHILKMEKIGGATSTVTKEVVLRETGCGTGFYGDRWFYDEQTQEYLQPCQFGKPTLAYESLIVGNKYSITYSLSTSKECQNNYPTNVNCVWLPKGQPIDLLAVQVSK
jgi:hypothetical protein